MDDQLVEEVRGSPANPSVVRRFEGWRWQQTGNVTTEQVLPMLRLSGPLATVVATEPDGHAVLTWTWNSATGLIAAESTDLVGANGLDLADRSSQTPVGTPAWPLDGLHGAEADASEELLHFGARHMAMRDGLWLQPEPLLYLGPTNGDLRNPLGFGSLYAMGNSNSFMDLSGYIPITEKGLKENPSPETLELSPENCAGLVSLNDGTVARQNNPLDPAVMADKKPENSQALEIPTDGGQARFVGEVDTTNYSNGPAPPGGNNGHGHGYGGKVGPSPGGDQATAVGAATNSSQGIGLVEVANAKSDGVTNKTGAVLAVRTDAGIVVSRYLSQGDNLCVMVRQGTALTLPSGP
ncbi:MAG: hypothetical protein H6738_12165 [Alphaproteobacteria bacterium]|nr:hypothetical protein [Alphaproteobacteria bacterium]